MFWVRFRMDCSFRLPLSDPRPLNLEFHRQEWKFFLKANGPADPF